MSNEFEPVDFAMQSPCAMAELLDAAGIDGSVPHSRTDDSAGGLDGIPPDAESSGF